MVGGSARTSIERTPRALRDVLREEKQRILEAWEKRARKIPAARDLSAKALRDHLPHLLDEIARCASERRAGEQPPVPDMQAHVHALERLAEGFGLAHVVSELAELRDTVLEVWSEDGARAIDGGETRLLNEAFDQAMIVAIDHYAHSRDQALFALDRISTAALASTDLDQLLLRLLGVLRDSTAALDVAAILLIEDGGLRVRATIGLEDEMRTGFRLEVGEGFAGTIAQKARPLELSDASADPLVRSPSLKRLGVKALFGVPLLDPEGRVIGVAYMGSLTAHEFSEQDRRLFSSMAARATAGIYQHLLRRQAEHRAEEAHASKVSLEREVRVREDILAVVSHDLRNPLNTIDLSATLLLRSADKLGDDRMRAKLEAIKRSTDRMTRLISDLLDMAQIRAGRLAIEPVEQRVHQLFEEACAAHEPIAAERGIVLASGEVDQTLEVRCDHGRILQVLGNLLGNAIKFSKAGDRVELQLTPGAAEIVVSICDTGPGIAPDAVERIFDPYWSGAKHAKQGTGLGLFISKGIVEAHGGRIWVDTRPGRGSTFSFSLPRYGA